MRRVVPKWIDALPALGSGIGFRPEIKAALFQDRSAADFLELVTDHYIDASPVKLRELDLLAAHYPLVPHSLNLSLGSADGLDDNYLDQIAAFVDSIDPPWWSDHIAFTRAGEIEIGHLAPMPLTRSSLDVLTRNITHAKKRVGRPLILENITYSVELPGAEMSEPEFLAELLEATDCGLLLDVTNLFINSANLGFDAGAYIDQLPIERVVQLHYSGGRVDGGVWIDSHSRPTPAEVWDLADEIMSRTAVKATLLEWDSDVPPLADLRTELERARDMGRRHHCWT